MKHYKNWTYIFILFNLLFIVFPIFLFLNFLNNRYDLHQMENKQYLIKENNPKLIFAGDSRAERQLSPIIASNYLNMKLDEIVNIAVPSGDVVRLEYFIKKFPNKFKNTTIILSISAFHLNDKTTELGYFSDAYISKLNLFEQFYLFSNSNFNTLESYYKNAYEKLIVQKDVYHKIKWKRLYSETNGFLEVNNIFKPKGPLKLNNHIKNISWYKENNNFYGFKNKITYDSLKFIKENVRNLIIYTGFLAPSYIDISKTIHHFKSEQEFKKSLKELCDKLEIKLITNDDFDSLKDEDFSDTVHLNKYGAEKFTKMILSKVY